MIVDLRAARGRGLCALVLTAAVALCAVPAGARAALSIEASPANPRPREDVTFRAVGDCDPACGSWSWKVGAVSIIGAGLFGPPEPATLEGGFAGTGTYNVTLAYARIALFPPYSVEVVKPITVVSNRGPTAAFTVAPATPVIGQVVTFTDTSTDPEGDPLTRAWDTDNDGAFDDGEGRTATRAFTGFGAKTARLRVTDSFGAAATTTRTVTVANAPPSVSFSVTPTTVPTGASVAFSAAASDPDGGAVTYAWDLDGDGAYDDATVAAPPPRSYPRAGSRTIGVRVTDDDGDPATSTVQRTATLTITNRPPSVPAITATPAAPQPGGPVELRAAATDPENTPLTFTWDLDGDGAYDDAAGDAVSLTFPASGDLVARVRAADADGGATSSAPVTIAAATPPGPAPAPEPAPEPTPAPAPVTVATTGTLVPAAPAAPVIAAAPAPAPATTPAATAPRPAASRPRLLRPFPRVRIQGRITRRGARFRRITITAPRGSRVIATCKGRGCPRRFSATVGRSGSVRLRRFLRAYRAGTRLTIRVTRAGAIGKYTSIVVRRRRAPARTDRCLRPGKAAPSRCPAN